MHEQRLRIRDKTLVASSVLFLSPIISLDEKIVLHNPRVPGFRADIADGILVVSAILGDLETLEPTSLAQVISWLPPLLRKALINLTVFQRLS